MEQTGLAIAVRYPRNAVAVLDIRGDLTGGGEALLSDVYAGLDNDAVAVVVLNFEAMDYMNSSGIGLLVTLLVRVNDHNQTLVATGLNDHYREIFEVTRLSEAIKIFATEEAAVASA